MDSSRLPAKSILPIANYPMAILSVLRASNTGLETILATSNREIDDILVRQAITYGIKIFRGSATDVRQRYLDACADLSDDAILVRLTGDNTFPDGNLIQEVAEFLISSNLIYTSTRNGGLPYGVAVEAMRLGDFRDSISWRSDEYAKEHVTPALIDRYGDIASEITFEGKDLRYLRCTVDTLQDYAKIEKIFSTVHDPVSAKASELVTLLFANHEPSFESRGRPRLRIGTAQLATPYGTILKSKAPLIGDAINLVQRIAALGLGIDTARAYDGAEEIIGAATRFAIASPIDLVSKVDPFLNIPSTSDPELVCALTELSVLRSRLACNSSCPSILLHRFSHLSDWDGAVWKTLRTLQAKNEISAIGVSIYTPTEARIAINDFSIEIIQLPFNILDDRWADAGIIDLLSSNEDIKVHVRSIFLQGILLRGEEYWPNVTDSPSLIINALAALALELGRMSIADLCLSYVRGHSAAHQWIDDVIIGVESQSQLNDNLELFSQPPLNQSELAIVRSRLPIVSEQLLNPAEWERK